MPPDRIDKIINSYDQELANCLKIFIRAVSPNKDFTDEVLQSIDRLSLAEKFFIAKITLLITKLVADKAL